MSHRLATYENLYNYKLIDCALLRQSFTRPITSHRNWRLAGITVADVEDRFATQLDIGGAGYDWICFNAMRAGTMAVVQSGNEVVSSGRSGTALRARAGTRCITSNDSSRANVWIKASLFEEMLEQMLGDRLRHPLEFGLAVEWDKGLAASLQGQFRYLAAEISRTDGLASNAVALASFTDLVVRTALQGIPSNYTEHLAYGQHGAVPAYVRRAEEFMHAHAASPIQGRDIAYAAGCSLRTLEGAFGHFRNTTPFRALQAIRLERIRLELRADEASESTADIARRYGFTNAARFATAYRCRFGEPASRGRRARSRPKLGP